MEMCSRAVMINLRRLCRLFLQTFPKIPASIFPGVLKAFQSVLEHVRHRPLMEAAVAAAAVESPELPVDMVTEILARLEIPDLLRAGAVCSSWHAAYTSLRGTGSYRRRQTPCLLYTSDSDADDVACLYSLAEDRVYRLTLPAPAIRRRHLIGSSNGWLVTADERSELHIVNPITGEQIALPPVATIEQVRPIFNDAGEVQEYEMSHFSGEEVYLDPTIHAVDELRDHLYSKAFVFPDNTSSGSYIVVLLHKPYDLSFARAGDSKWTALPATSATTAHEDCIFVDGILYAVTATSAISAFDLTGPTYSMKVIVEDKKSFIDKHIYITQTPIGEILLVWRHQNLKVEGDEDEDAPEDVPSEFMEDEPSEFMEETGKIRFFKVDMEAKKLVEINGLHDHVLFLGNSQSYCLGAEEYPSLKANHAYLTDNDRYIAFFKTDCRDICVFNLESNSIEEIVPPQCWCSWPAPIWITPNLSKMS